MRSCFQIMAIAVSLLAGPSFGAGNEPAGPGVPTYHAVYRVEYQGQTAGTSEVTLRYDAERDVYEYLSATNMTGAYKLLLPGTVTARSEFRFEQGRVMPQRAWFSDGKRNSSQRSVEFDWESLKARTAGNEFSVEQGTMDPGTLQVVLMIDLSTSKPLAPYSVLDDGELKTYLFSRSEAGNPDLGKLDLRSELLVQRREGSAKRTRLWVAPDLFHLPVRIEQDSGLTLVLERVDGLG